MTSPGKLIIISGPSGTGKTSIWKELVNRFGYVCSTSVTTREPRPGEKDGVDYFFVTKDKFEEMIRSNGFIEYAEVHGNMYGTPLKNVEEIVGEGKTLILEIDVQGALQLKTRGINALYIFVQAPSFEILRSRLVNRKSDSPEVIKRRLEKADWEMKQAEQYDYVITNEDLEKSIAEAHRVIEEFLPQGEDS